MMENEAYNQDYNADARTITRLAKELIRHAWDEMTDWEKSFCENIEETYEKGGSPTGAQIAKMEQLRHVYILED